MDKRFLLSAAGIAGATVAAPALAQDAAITMHLDYWAGEHSMSASAGDRGFSTSVSSGYLVLNSSGSIITATSFTNWESGVDAYTSGYRWEILLANATGNYNVVLSDSYGDGWAWENCTGSDAFVAAGSDVVGGPVAIGLTSGFSATGEFTVAPAPGASLLEESPDFIEQDAR